jgi:hypothetical protein
MTFPDSHRGIVAAIAAPALLVLAAHASCRSERETVYPPTPPIDYTRDAGNAESAAPDAARADSGGAAAEGGSAPPAPLPLDPITQSRILMHLDQRAGRAAAGTKDGPVIAGVLREGGRLEHSLTLHPARCYSVFAAGDAPGIGELDVELRAQVTLPLPQPGPLLSVDNMTGADAAITPCWRSLVPVVVPALVTVKVTRGQGPVVAQVYSKESPPGR